MFEQERRWKLGSQIRESSVGWTGKEGDEGLEEEEGCVEVGGRRRER